MGRSARLFAVVPAAGRGERFGGQRAKQYATLLGRPVLAWSLRALLAEPAIKTVVVALSAGDRRFAKITEPVTRGCAPA